MGVAGCIANVLQKCGEVVVDPGDGGDPDQQGVTPTGVAPLAPGLDEHQFAPAGSVVPANLTALRALGALGQTDAWNDGEYVRVANSDKVHWGGDNWLAGPAPD